MRMQAENRVSLKEVGAARRCGTSESGEFCPALSTADVYSGRAELRPFLNKSEKRGLETFPSRALIAATARGLSTSPSGNGVPPRVIRFTRSRPYRKNGNCYAGQKNNSRARNFADYCRFPSAAERDAMAAACRSPCPPLNCFARSEVFKQNGGWLQNKKRHMIKNNKPLPTAFDAAGYFQGA
jgi:hypothetical protein